MTYPLPYQLSSNGSAMLHDCWLGYTARLEQVGNVGECDPVLSSLPAAQCRLAKLEHYKGSCQHRYSTHRTNHALIKQQTVAKYRWPSSSTKRRIAATDAGILGICTCDKFCAAYRYKEMETQHERWVIHAMCCVASISPPLPSSLSTILTRPCLVLMFTYHYHIR